jgi:catechol 2,3-dioxygenase-like lactoylglutathione lyase family enzyme
VLGVDQGGGVVPTISRLGHVGIHVRDLERSKAFYTEVLGLSVTDEDEEMGMVFLSARPEVEHHELLLCRGRTGDSDVRVVQQISFRCPTLEDVIGFRERLADAGVELDMVVSHGNAIGIYFYDPDHNRCEVYFGTGLPARQPYLDDVDLAEPADAIMTKVRQSVATHGAEGWVNQDFLAKQDLTSG